MTKTDIGISVKTPASQIKDDGKVRMGTISPSFPPARSTPANVADRGQVLIGTISPSFPPLRSR